ncbi:MAG: LPS export ABC transporter periplasmic protein LptC [Alphaproteobacteria bacterium]|nr:LPS export ABC transporter periplasmic protein LptC [Alphaproteobacteria bacterium]
MFFYSSYKSSTSSLLQNVKLVNSSQNIRYNGLDTKGRAFVVTSINGHEISGNQILLQEPEAVLDLNEGGKVKLRGNQGVYDKGSKILLISGNVHLNHTNGLNLMTSEASINLDAGTAENSVPVEGYNESSTIKAQSFKISDHGKNVLFQGQPELVIHPKK